MTLNMPEKTNREIRFRAWVDKSKMIFSSDTYGDYIDFFMTCRKHNDGFGGCYLMQFTGLKDKNGKEIYEGDILSMDNGRYNDQPLKTLLVCINWKGNFCRLLSFTI